MQDFQLTHSRHLNGLKLPKTGGAIILSFGASADITAITHIADTATPSKGTENLVNLLSVVFTKKTDFG